MIISYDDFQNKLNEKLSNNIALYYELLIKIINNPYRFIGNFRVTNPKTKLIQYVTQSREILFGNFMEDIISQYLTLMGFTQINKYVGQSSENKPLMADQLCGDDNTIYFIEQKMRDDHDSAKKRGQFNNFKEKIEALTKSYPNKIIISVMWFIDDGLKKNKKYYNEEISKLSYQHVYLKYGKELFVDIFNRVDVWDEIINHLEKSSSQRSEEVLQIPDMDTSSEFLDVLRHLQNYKPKLYKTLTTSNAKQYKELRKKLFPKSCNFDQLKRL